MAGKDLPGKRTVKSVLFWFSLEHRTPLPRGCLPVLQPDFISAAIKRKAAINIDIIGQWASEHKSQCSTQVL